jgi:hypothetical protein
MASLEAATDMPDLTAGANGTARDAAAGTGRDQQQQQEDGSSANPDAPGNVLKKISDVMKVRFNTTVRYLWHDLQSRCCMASI